MAITLGELYKPLVIAFQLILALTIFWNAKGRLRNILAGLILLSNGLETLWAALAPLNFAPEWTIVIGSTDIWHMSGRRVNMYLEGIIASSLVYLLALTPKTPGRRTQRWLSIGYASYLALFAILVFGEYWRDRGAAQWDGLVNGTMFVAAIVVATLWTWPRTRRLPHGPLRIQSLIILVAISFALMQQLAALTALHWKGYLEHGYMAAVPQATWWNVPLYTTALYFALVLAASLLWFALRHRAPGRGLLLWGTSLTIVAASLRVAYTFGWGEERSEMAEFFSQFLRPILIGFAMLRFDLFKLPKLMVRPLAFGITAMGTVAIFVFIQLLAARGDLATSNFSTGSMVLAILTVLVMAGIVMPNVVRSLEQEVRSAQFNTRKARLEHYRLALERGDKNLEELREQLGISTREADAIATVLDGNVVLPMQAVQGLKEGDLLQSRYHIGKPLGQGGQGSIHQATDVKTQQMVVVKSIHDGWAAGSKSRWDNLRTEARINQLVGRPSQILEEPYALYMIRPYIAGQNLAEHIAHHGPLKSATLSQIAQDLATAVTTLHKHGLAHGDIKPANIILTPDGHAVLIDEGAAKHDDQTQHIATGSMNWLAPEQSQTGPTRSSDSYQLARVLAFAATGSLHKMPDALRQTIEMPMATRPSPQQIAASMTTS